MEIVEFMRDKRNFYAQNIINLLRKHSEGFIVYIPNINCAYEHFETREEMEKVHPELAGSPRVGSNIPLVIDITREQFARRGKQDESSAGGGLDMGLDMSEEGMRKNWIQQNI